MSKNRKHLMRSSLIMLIVAAVSLSSATYAWFTTGKTTKITGIEFTAQAASGIQMSANKTTWASTLSSAQIKTAQTDNLVGELTSVSSAGTVTDGALQLYTGVLQESGDIVTADASKATSGTAGYYTFDIWFWNSGDDALDLYLCTKDGGYSVTEGDPAKTTKIQDQSTMTDKTAAAKGETPAIVDKNTSLAIRLATVATASKSSISDLTGVKGDSSSIWEPNADEHTDAAKASRHEIGTDGKPVAANAVNAQDLSYVGINTAMTFYAEADATASPAKTQTIYEGAVIVDGTDGANAKLVKTTKDDEDMKICTLSANSYAKVTFYIWVEGQDADCMNDISGGTVDAALNFYAKK